MLKKIIIFIIIFILLSPIVFIGGLGIFTTAGNGIFPYLFGCLSIASIIVIGVSYKTLFMKKEIVNK